MNKRQREVEKAKLADEKKVLDALRKQYEQAAKDVQGKINIHTNKINIMLNEWDELDDVKQSIIQAQIYQRKFQQQLKAQLDDIIDKMDSNMFETVQEYLDKCYVTGFVGTAYDLHGQDIPIITPINQKAMLEAVTLDPKLSDKLYGEYMNDMKREIRGEISRGIATADSFANIARNISNKTNVGLNKTMRIVRTEGHRIQIDAAVEMQYKAKAAGADVLKQWDATLDGKTRDSHRMVDGELRELHETFSNGLKHPADSSGGAAEVVNCRCALLQRAKWALDDEELETLKQRAEYFGLDKTENFREYENKYLKATQKIKVAEGQIIVEKANMAEVPLPKSIREKNKKSTFIPAKSIEEATTVAKELGVKYAIYDDLPLETANLFNEALLTIPKEARPVFVGSSKSLEQYRGAKLPRTSKNYYGVSIYTTDIRLGMNEYDWDTYGNMVGISSYYKTAGKITTAKQAAQEAYMKKHDGAKWFFNEYGESTLFHEMGHAYADKYGLPDGFEMAAERWAKESGCDMLKKVNEAWAEAWGAYHTKNPDLPDYISEYIKAASVQKTTNKAKAVLPLFDDDGIIAEKIEQFRKDFEAGKISTKISYQKQGRHIKGRKEFEAYKERMFAKVGKYPSYVREDLTSKDLERLVVPKLQGNVQVNSNYEYREFVKCDEVIGYYYDKAQGKYVATNVAQIKYALGDKNIHIIPVKGL